MSLRATVIVAASLLSFSACGSNDDAAAVPDCGAHASRATPDGDCACDPGFTGPADACEDVDECAQDQAPCDPDRTCVNTTGGWECACPSGFVVEGHACAPAPPRDPATYTRDEVCGRYAYGMEVTELAPFDTPAEACDPGVLKPGAIADTLRRLDMFRWFAGLSPVTHDPVLDAAAQKCANLQAWWISFEGNPHNPPHDAPCYTDDGAKSASESNIAWSPDPASSIDRYMIETWNETTMGHRRWILNPPLAKVGIGHWEQAGTQTHAQCLRVIDRSGEGRTPPWVAVPNPGFVPLPLSRWTWTFHGESASIPDATVTVRRLDGGAAEELPVVVHRLDQGYGQNTVSWNPVGWETKAGGAYEVTIGLAEGDVVYVVKPINCGL